MIIAGISGDGLALIDERQGHPAVGGLGEGAGRNNGLDAQCGGRLPQQLATGAEIVARVGLVAAGGDVVVVAVAAGLLERQAEGQGIAERTATGDIDAVLIVAAAIGAALDLVGPGRVLGAHIDDATQGPASVERALRTAQQLHGVDIVERAEVAHAALRFQRDAIDVEADRRPAARRLLLAAEFGRCAIADAADAEHAAAMVIHLRGVGGVLPQIVQLAVRALLDVRGSVGGDRERDLLDVLGTLGRLDDDDVCRVSAAIPAGGLGSRRRHRIGGVTEVRQQGQGRAAHHQQAGGELTEACGHGRPSRSETERGGAGAWRALKRHGARIYGLAALGIEETSVPQVSYSILVKLRNSRAHPPCGAATLLGGPAMIGSHLWHACRNVA